MGGGVEEEEVEEEGRNTKCTMDMLKAELTCSATFCTALMMLVPLRFSLQQ